MLDRSYSPSIQIPHFPGLRVALPSPRSPRAPPARTADRTTSRDLPLRATCPQSPQYPVSHDGKEFRHRMVDLARDPQSPAILLRSPKGATGPQEIGGTFAWAGFPCAGSLPPNAANHS